MPRADDIALRRHEHLLVLLDRDSNPIGAPAAAALAEDVDGSRKVIAFMSQVHFDPDMAVEIFVFEPNGGES